MDKRKILIVANNVTDTSSPRSMRTAELVNELVKRGHEVTLLSILNNSKLMVFDAPNLTLKDLGKMKFPVYKFGRFKFLNFFGTKFNSITDHLFEYPSIELFFKIKKILGLESGYDLMISIAVPYSIHWGCAWAKKNNNKLSKIWVADCGDPFMGRKTAKYSKPFYFGFIERWSFRIADYISIPIQEAKDAYYAEFHNKIKVIPQGIDLRSIRISEDFVGGSIPTFIYAGGFILGIRDPRLFLDFLSALDINFRFIIFTKGNGYDLIQPYIKRMGSKIEVRDYIPRHELIYLMSQVDFLVNFDNNSNTAQPSKLIDYAITKRPVLNITSTLNQDSILQFLNGNYECKMTLPDINQFETSVVVDKFLELSIS